MAFLELNPSSVLSAMLAPALLMAATASLLISANARLARVVDRLRALLKGYQVDRPEHAYRGEMISRHRMRSKLILRAIAFLYSALAGFIGTSLALSINVLGKSHVALLPVALSIFGVIMLMLGCLMMWLEVSKAVRTFEEEMDHEIRNVNAD